MGTFDDRVNQCRAEFDKNIEGFNEFLESQDLKPGADLSSLEIPEEFDSRLAAREQNSLQCATMGALWDEQNANGGNITEAENMEIQQECVSEIKSSVSTAFERFEEQYSEYIDSVISMGETPESAIELAEEYFADDYELMASINIPEIVGRCMLNNGGFVEMNPDPNSGVSQRLYLDPETGKEVTVEKIDT